MPHGEHAQSAQGPAGHFGIAQRDGRKTDAGLGSIGKRVAGKDVHGQDLFVAEFDLPGAAFQRAHWFVGGADSGGGPNERRTVPNRLGALSGFQQTIEHAGRVLGRLFGVRMRILAVDHKAVRAFGHLLRKVGMQVQDAYQRQLGRAGQAANAGQQFTLGVGE